VRVVFRKVKRGWCVWEAFVPKRRAVTAMGGTAGRGLPHDLAQFLVEREHGHRHGFWGRVADGATFRSFVSMGRRRTPQGKAVIQRHAGELDAAEADANGHVHAWLQGLPTPLAPTFDEMRARWLALPEGGELELDFPLATGADGGRPRRRQAATPAAGE
jgi:hypothetical protein